MGKKRVKGEGAMHDEQKSQVGGIWLTPTAKNALTEAAAALGISRSELIERLGRKGVAWLKDAVKSHLGAMPEEQIEKNKPAMEWAKARLKDAEDRKAPS